MSNTRETTKKILLKQKKAILNSAKEGIKALRSGEEVGNLGSGLEEGDQAAFIQEKNMKWTRLKNQHHVMRAIDLALERINAGTYGMCEECNGEIGEERLRVVPFALYCKECQEDREMLRRGQLSHK